MLLNKLPMNLQYFADPNGAPASGQPDNTDSASSISASQAGSAFVSSLSGSMGSQASGGSAQGSAASSASGSAAGSEEGTVYTQAELDGMIASRADRAYQKGLKEGKTAGASEAEKLASMTDEQKLAAHYQEIDAENKRLKAENTRSKMTTNVQSRLLEHGYTLSDDEAQMFVNVEDAQQTDANANKFIKLADRIVAAKQKELFKHHTPASGNGTPAPAENIGEVLSKQAHAQTRTTTNYFSN